MPSIMQNGRLKPVHPAPEFTGRTTLLPGFCNRLDSDDEHPQKLPEICLRTKKWRRATLRTTVVHPKTGRSVAVQDLAQAKAASTCDKHNL